MKNQQTIERVYKAAMFTIMALIVFLLWPVEAESVERKNVQCEIKQTVTAWHMQLEKHIAAHMVECEDGTNEIFPEGLYPQYIDGKTYWIVDEVEK